MPVDYNKKDFNLNEIFSKIDLNDFKLKYNYRFHGLKQADRPPILIELDPRLVKVEENKIKTLVKFLNERGVRTVFNNLNREEKAQIYVGLRQDVRKDFELSRKIINAVVHILERNVKVPSKIRGAKKVKFKS